MESPHNCLLDMCAVFLFLTQGIIHKNDDKYKIDTLNFRFFLNTIMSNILMNIFNTIRDFVLYFCCRIIFGPVEFKLIVASFIVVFGSIFKYYDIAPHSYLALKSNIFNQYFVKLGWAWTLGLLIPFIYLTLITKHSHFEIITRHLSRILIATGVWYIVTLSFIQIELYTGQCKHDEMKGLSRRVCVKSGYEWEEGVDFSGHTFLLLYAILIINEEVKSYLASKAATPNNNTISNANQKCTKVYSNIIRILFALLAALTIIWEFMLLSTALYFHHMFDKIVAAIIAVFFWYITYYVWYRSDSGSLLCPQRPKQSENAGNVSEATPM